MCGFVGVVNLDGAPADLATASRMAAALTHRGPDDEGVDREGPVAFGFRRLSVLDVRRDANQPMRTPHRTGMLVYNGEIYNFRELRRELQRLGRTFRTTGDTEVVLHALDQWGADAVPRFNGMFAIAFWDQTKRELLLARDRYGIKPLYHCLAGGELLFGSEIKALARHGRFTTSLNPRALIEYLTFQNFFGSETIFDGVELLPPGTFAFWKPGNRSLSTRRYWDFSFQEPDHPAEKEEYVEELDRLFRAAVQRQLVSDVPIGAYLSGGTDTGGITALASAELPNLRTFTVGFDTSSASGLEIAFDERAKAERMSYLFGTEQYEMVLKAGDMERAMSQLVWHLEEPRVGQSYPNFYAAKLASSFGKVVLSGAGGDELFAGYPWRYYRAVINDSFEHYIDKYFKSWQRLIPNGLADELFSPLGPVATEVRPRDIFRNVFPNDVGDLTRPEDYINHSLYFEAKTFLHGLLVMEDKLSMAHGLETRVPFLDNDLVDFAMRVPVRYKLGNLGEVVRLNENEPGPKTARYFERTRDGKLLLRESLERVLPVDVAQEAKQGFSGPDASWFRGDSIDYVRRILVANHSPIYEYLDRASVHSIVDDHLTGNANHRLFIWSLLYLDEWCRTFLSEVQA